jgi:hypothetical protein
MQGTADWTVIVSAIAGVLSAIAALIATIIAVRTFKQQRQDKEDDLEYKRPKFKLVAGHIQPRAHMKDDDGSIYHTYHLTLELQNINIHPAFNVELESKIINEDGTKIADFLSQPLDEIGERDSFEETRKFSKPDSVRNTNFLRLRLTYTDSRTRREYSQLLYRKFIFPVGSVSKIELLELDRSEWGEYMETQKRAVKAQRVQLQEVEKKFQKAFEKSASAEIDKIVKSPNKNN